ncbi:unnamed protein product [Phytophthora lilii]|uniref:Unnamed protein product n=1 Tax=Phytophthora lilii TaxID=2077276 RepID=A0A9W6XE18_9STRA|nr:unnamed protein product [Phytophthora lilii]
MLLSVMIRPTGSFGAKTLQAQLNPEILRAATQQIQFVWDMSDVNDELSSEAASVFAYSRVVEAPELTKEEKAMAEDGAAAPTIPTRQLHLK